jgi:hypothetical protein
MNMESLPVERFAPSAHEDLDARLIRQSLARYTDSFTSFGAKNALFSSLAALVELHLSTPSGSVPYFKRTGESLFLKYYGRPNEYGGRYSNSVAPLEN